MSFRLRIGVTSLGAAYWHQIKIIFPIQEKIFFRIFLSSLYLRLTSNERARARDKRSCNCIHAALTSPKSGNIFNIFSFCPLIRLNGGGRARCICSGGGRAAQWRGAVDSTRWRGEKGGKGGEGSAGAQLHRVRLTNTWRIKSVLWSEACCYIGARDAYAFKSRKEGKGICVTVLL